MWVYLYQSWTEKELKNAYIGEVWTPTSNTVLYRPLTANANDESWNGYNGTWRNTTYSSTNWAYLIGKASWIDFPSSFKPWTSFTYSIWTKRLPNQWDLLITNRISSYRYIYFRIKDTGELTLFYGNWSTSQSEWNNIATVSDSVWHNIILVKDWINGTVYVDGVSKWTHTFVYNPSPQKVSWGEFCIWQTSSDTTSRDGVYDKDCIFESKLRTAQEVSHYFDITKSNYWL